jgi:serine/threonine-protein kinase
VHQVGVGVLGPVFRAYDPEQDRAVAVKAFPLDITPERARELAADLGRLPALGLDHPAVIAPLAAGSEGATVYLVQEYFVAESADVALKQYGPAPVPDAMRLVGQLAGALDAAAAAGVHHGALHPRDILVAPHEVRLTGLGVAEALERAGVRAPLRRPYAAPERASGGQATAAADVFSLACVAFELVTGRRPAQSGDAVTADTAAIQAADAVALAEVFARALSPRPDDRYPAALAFAAALKHALTGEPLGAGHESERPKSRRAGRPAQKAQVAEEPPAPLPADLLLAAPLGSEPRYDPAAALIRQEARLSEAVTEPLAELPSAPPPGATPLPSFLESYALAETQPAPLETTLLDLPAPEPAADMPAALDPIVLDAPAAERAAPSPGEPPDHTLAEAEIQTVIDVPPPALATEPVPLRLEALDLDRDADTLDDARDTRPDAGPLFEGIDALPARDDAPAPAVVPLEPAPPLRPELFASTPRRNLFPLIAMLIAGIALGYPAGYLMAPRSQPAPAAPSAPVSKPAPPPAATAPAPAPPASRVPTTPAPATTAAPSKPTATTAPPAPAPAAKKPAPPPVAAATTRKPPPATTKPAAFVGSLSVSSRPAGATVTLDGRVVGVTPLTLPEVAAGSHAVRLQLEGYRTWSVSAQVVTGQAKRVNASLERHDRRPER